MTNLNKRMMLDVRIEPTTVRKPGGRASNRVTVPGISKIVGVKAQIVHIIEDHF